MAGRGRRDEAPRGIALMLGAVFCMIGLDATAKWLLADYGLGQLVLLRCLFSVLVIGAYAARGGGLAALATARPAWHLLRSLLMAGSMFAFFHALRFIPLADVMTFAFASPLLVTALSWPLLGERVGPWRWFAVAVGFAGVVVVLRPGAGLVEPAAGIALAGAALFACLALTARRLTATESTAALSLYLFGVPLAAGALLAPATWRWPGAADWLLFAVCGACGGLAFVLMNAAYRRAPAAVLVPFEYTGLIWAALVGFVVWGERPAASTWAGAALIIGAGLVILYREAVTHRSDPQADFPLQESVVVGVDPRDGPPRG